jgi:hypothetical protein
VQAQLEVFPNPISKAVASIICAHKARHAEGAEQARFWAEQSRLFSEARRDFSAWPDVYRSDARIREVMQLGYRSAALALSRQGRHGDALATCDEARAAAPELPHAWTLSGVMTSPNPDQGEPMFRHAIELGEESFYPYAFLAFRAVKRGNFAEALEMATQALRRGGDEYPDMKSLLLQWAAISHQMLGADGDTVGALFVAAVEASPGNGCAKENLRRFQEKEGSFDTPDDIGLVRLGDSRSDREEWGLSRMSSPSPPPSEMPGGMAK